MSTSIENRILNLILDNFIRKSNAPYRYALNITNGNESLAKEAFSESFVRVIDRYDNLRSFSTDRLFSYMLVVIKHTVFDLAKKERKNIYWDTLDTLPDDDVDPLRESIQRIDETNIKKCVEQLSIHDQTLIKLRYYDNMSDDEIAEALDISRASIRSEFSRMHRRLRKLYLEFEKE